ncbi:MAG: sulfate ABC transporter ATP-binding protein [Phycisphaerae bacterium]|nr:sulfate ABC transporter ATP-binding protein [Phycisphaerae bacterium]
MSIEVGHITKTFGTFRALDDVSLTVPTGQLVALLGPSGSGKTTLLRVIAGLEQADAGSGSIHFHDEDMATRPVRHRHVGFVFQHYALFRHMSVFDNVAFGLRVRPRRTRPSRQVISEKVHQLLRLVQLDGLADRYPSQLSGGQRQRVALARALAVEPKVLLLDEPFGALDAKVRKELRTWLRRLHDELHVTSVFVTHDQDEALEVADQVVVMSEGRIEQVGTPDEVFHHPQTEFVMKFLGDVNAFHCRVDSGTVQFGSLELPFPEQRQQIDGDARVFIRPYDVTIDTKTNGLPAVTAEILRVHSAGPVVRVELRTANGQSLIAELSQERFGTMDLQVGKSVFVRPRHIRVFTSS